MTDPKPTRHVAVRVVSERDVREISDVKSRYLQFVDDKNWTGVRSLFTDDARFEGFAFGASTGADEFVSVLASFMNDLHSQHMAFAPRFALIGDDHVRARWGLWDYLRWAPDSRLYKGIAIPGMYGIRGYGEYQDEYLRTSLGWRISFCRLARTRIDPLVGPGGPEPAYDLTPADPLWVG